MRGVGEEPVFALEGVLRVIDDGRFGDVVERFDHHFLDSHEPVFDRPGGEDGLREGNAFGHDFGLRGDHGEDFLGLGVLVGLFELNEVDVVETFSEMRLDRVGVTRL